MLLTHEIRKLIESNPLLADKLALPPMQNQRLRHLVQLGCALTRKSASQDRVRGAQYVFERLTVFV